MNRVEDERFSLNLGDSPRKTQGMSCPKERRFCKLSANGDHKKRMDSRVYKIFAKELGSRTLRRATLHRSNLRPAEKFNCWLGFEADGGH